MNPLQITPGPQKAPHGPELHCKDWHAEAALRMFSDDIYIWCESPPEIRPWRE